MDQFLLAAAKTNSPAMLFAAALVLLLYYVIKGQREKTATKRDADKKDQEVRIALQEKDIENLKAQVMILSNRWDTLQNLLSKMNENLAAIRENLSSMNQRIERIEREREYEREHNWEFCKEKVMK